MRSVQIGGVSLDPNKISVELDSHADACVVGESCGLITHDFQRPVRVHGCDGNIGEAKPCRTVSMVVAYDDC